MVAIQYSEEVLLIGKAILIAILGILLAFIAKVIVRKIVDKGILKKIFKDAHLYETATTINTIFAETLQWVIIIGSINYSLTMLGFNFLSNALAYVITNIPVIAIFALILIAGWFIAKLVTSRIKEQEMENKNEIITLTELVIIAAFFLTALEFIGVMATALVELYKVILYIIGIVIVLLIINPKFFEKARAKAKKEKSSTMKLFSF